MDKLPTIALEMSNVLFLPMIGILFLNKNPNVKKSEPNDLKKTI